MLNAAFSQVAKGIERVETLADVLLL